MHLFAIKSPHIFALIHLNYVYINPTITLGILLRLNISFKFIFFSIVFLFISVASVDQLKETIQGVRYSSEGSIYEESWITAL